MSNILICYSVLFTLLVIMFLFLFIKNKSHKKEIIEILSEDAINELKKANEKLNEF